MLKFTTVVHELRHRGKYRYGVIMIESSDLTPLIGKKVRVIVVPEGCSAEKSSEK